MKPKELKAKKVTLEAKNGEQIVIQIKNDCFVLEYNDSHYLISNNKIEKI